MRKWPTNRRPGKDDRGRKARAASKASRDGRDRRVIQGGVVSMARAASRVRKAIPELPANPVHWESLAFKASLARKARPARAASLVQPANCLRSNR